MFAYATAPEPPPPTKVTKAKLYPDHADVIVTEVILDDSTFTVQKA